MTRGAISVAVWAAVAVVVYAVMWVAYAQHWGVVAWLDGDLTGLVRRYTGKHPGWVTFWNVFCTVFSPEGFRVIGLVAVVVSALQRNLRAVLFVLACIGLSGVLSSAAKALADRPRPAEAATAAAGSSFPSGHAVAAMAGVLALLTITAGTRGRARRYLIALGVMVVIAVGFGRVVLAVHYPSDVLAGWALGYLWFATCLVVFRPRALAARSHFVAET